MSRPIGQHSIRDPGQLPLGPRYWTLWTATGLSSLGDGFLAVAFPLLAFRQTHNALLVAGVVAAGRAPWLFAAPLTGALADRRDRRRLIMGVEGWRMVILVLLGLAVATHTAQLVALYVTALALGMLESAFTAVSISLVPALVGRPQLVRANGFLDATQTAGAQFVGPALGGALFAAAAALPFVLDGASFGLSAILLGLALSARRARPRRAACGTSIHADIREGLRWLGGHPLLRLLAATIAILAFCQAMILAVLVIFGVQVLHLTNSSYGVFYGVTAIGNVLGGLVAHRAYRRLGIERILFGAAVLSGLSYVLLGATSMVMVAAGAMVVETVCVSVGNVASMSLRQQLIPSELMGRVGNNFKSLIYGALTLGALTGGGLTAVFGTRATFIIAGVFQLGLFTLLAPALSRRFREHEASERTTVNLREAPAPADAMAAAAPTG